MTMEVPPFIKLKHWGVDTLTLHDNCRTTRPSLNATKTPSQNGPSLLFSKPLLIEEIYNMAEAVGHSIQSIVTKLSVQFVGSQQQAVRMIYTMVSGHRLQSTATMERSKSPVWPQTTKTKVKTTVRPNVVNRESGHLLQGCTLAHTEPTWTIRAMPSAH